MSGIVTDTKHLYIQKQWPKIMAYSRTENYKYYINQRRKSLFTSAAHHKKIQGNGKNSAGCTYRRAPHIRPLVIRIANYLDRLGPSRKFVENSTKLTRLEIIGYQIKYSTVLWLLELQIKRGRKVWTQVHTVQSNSRTSNCQCSLFSKKIQLSRFSAYPDKWNSTMFEK